MFGRTACRHSGARPCSPGALPGMLDRRRQPRPRAPTAEADRERYKRRQDMAEASDSGHDHEHQAVPSDMALRVKALESLLVEKRLVDQAALDVLIDTYEHKVGPRNGARVVARAWVDGEFKRRLLADASAALEELGYRGGQGGHMVGVENTAPNPQLGRA